ncbi:MAG: Rpn family recombination-promoting nuclease/putative transposase [Coleofasciculus sp. Co-bin14]|nr:Rpn family recombination-promoting nuclease/putative transposase [Coleofasciculus sp. Co-bin14]
MKTDTIFYSLFQAFPSIFFELINQSPAEANAYEFTSREIKQLAFRIDGLFLPKTNDIDKPFYVVEVQFQPDEDFYYRLFGELFLYLRQYKPPHPWQVVVIYPSRSIEREQTLQFGEILALNRVRRIYLDELGETFESSLGVGVVKLVIEPEETAGELARRLIEQARQQLIDEATKRDLIDLIETIIVYKLPQKSREEIEAMLGLSELKQTKVYQEALEEGEQIGEQRGEQKAKLDAILRMLQLGLSLDVIAQSLDLLPEVVQQAAQSFHEQNIAALIQLLNTQRSLFSRQDLADLKQLIAPLPDDIEQLSQASTSWCKQEEHALILNALLEVRQTLLDSVLEGVLVTNANAETPDTQLNKQALQNVIGQSSASS